MTVPPGLFQPGARTGLADVAQALPLVPKEWLKAHPLTRRWTGRIVRDVSAASLLSPGVTDVLIDLNDGFEGMIERYVLFGPANTQGPNGGIQWNILIDGVPPVQVLFTMATGAALPSTQTAGWDYLYEGDGLGASWGQLDLPIPEGAVVQSNMICPLGNTWIGAQAWGLFWPVTIRDEWLRRGWRK